MRSCSFTRQERDNRNKGKLTKIKNNKVIEIVTKYLLDIVINKLIMNKLNYNNWLPAFAGYCHDRNRTGATQIISLINHIARKDLRYDIQY